MTKDTRVHTQTKKVGRKSRLRHEAGEAGASLSGWDTVISATEDHFPQ
jgi:hypothetical protein